jgi:hypothetical protein
MIPLSQNTIELIEKFYPNENKKKVIKILENECADNLPFLEKASPQKMERFRFAVLKIGKTNFNKLVEAIELGKIDWRDLLVKAKFANSTDAHKLWAKNKYKIG